MHEMDPEAEMEQRIERLELRMTAVEMGLKANTETTNSIKLDTAQLVLLFKASKLGAEIIKWCATIGGGAIVAYAAFKGIVTGR